jgi:hypothetical protein
MALWGVRGGKVWSIGGYMRGMRSGCKAMQCLLVLHAQDVW